MAKLRANRVVLHNPASRSSNWKRKVKQSRNQSSVMISSTVGGHQHKFGGPNQCVRENLLSKDFVNIHTPKLLAGSSEGGSAVFRLEYQGQPACLAQSPQLHKQMTICDLLYWKQYPFKPLKFLEKTLRLTFEEGVQILKEAGVEIDPLGDLNTESQRKLGQLVLEK
ncbi:hypothetical protein ARALYDRAFT_891103 [Arabidopsis lyrata subsp. lyrata]|uniref:Aminoacyl-tRNA synthetase class II (D/K/N) domain-containing protein n=1 Tax=Arabidopsis lyrata subsp. lyrata TaxID=81972 RepID=D7KKB4_ARALL|nr:hypothetical protein ARALYDRAFT_891103 [Arabidopsis lyrata subsp. lyrata]